MNGFTNLILLCLLQCCIVLYSSGCHQHSNFTDSIIPDSIANVVNIDMDWLTLHSSISNASKESVKEIFPKQSFFVVFSGYTVYKIKNQIKVEEFIDSVSKSNNLSLDVGDTSKYEVFDFENDIAIRYNIDYETKNHVKIFYDSLHFISILQGFKSKVLIPTFRLYSDINTQHFSEVNKSYLVDGFKIIVLKRGNTYVLSDEIKYDWKMLPSEIRHGYSNGLAYNKELQYLIIWHMAW